MYIPVCISILHYNVLEMDKIRVFSVYARS